MSQRTAANTVDVRDLSTRFQQARLNVNTLLGDSTVRAELRASAVAIIRGELERRRDLTPERRDALAEQMADARLQQLRAMADRNGYISGSRAAEVFRWLDSFDVNGTSRSIRVFASADQATGEAALTHAGRAFKRILESTENDVRFTEEEFVAGFMNGAFNPDRFRNLTTEQVDTLRRAGVYDQLRTRLERSQLPQELSSDALSRMFRRLDDKVDRDGNGGTMTARGPGAVVQRETPFTLEPRLPERAQENDTYRAVLILRGLFEQRGVQQGPSREESRPDSLIPPPSADLAESPLICGRDEPLAARTVIELDTFANYHRDARLDLGEIERTDPAAWQHLTEALRSAGVDVAELRRFVVSGDSIGGGTDRAAAGAAWQRLHAMLASNRFGGHNGVIRPWLNRANGERTPAGRVLEVLDRHTRRYELLTRQDLADRLAVGFVSRERLDHEVSTPSGPRRVADLLRDAGIDPEEVVRRGRSSGELGSYLFDTLAARPGNREDDLRPNTISLGDTRGGMTTESDAGRVLSLIRRHVLQGFEQQFRAYTQRVPDAEVALRDTNVRPVQITTRFSGYRDSDPAGCFRRAAETIASSNMARTTLAGGFNHYMAYSANNVLGAIRADERHLTAGRRAIDAMLDMSVPVQVAVMRRGDPGAARGNAGSGIRHSVTIDRRDTDSDGRVFYEGYDNATASRANARIRFYVDPRTNLLYAPTNPQGPVYLSQGGYQVSMVKVPSWIRSVTRLPGTRSDGRAYNDGLQGYHVTDPEAFFRHLGGQPMQGPMYAAPAQRPTSRVA